MSHKYQHVRINKVNRRFFEDFIPGIQYEKDGVEEYMIGTIKDGTPAGAAVVHRKDALMMIRSLRVESKVGGADICVAIIREVLRIAESKGCEEVEYRYTSDELGYTGDILRKAGFRSFKEEANVSVISSSLLAYLLTEDRKASDMRRECVRLIDEKKVRAFSRSPENARVFEELYPESDMSFMTINEKGEPESYAVISRLSDGSLYLADFYSAEGRDGDLFGLLYMSLGSVFMSIQPEGDFYIAAVEDRFDKLTRILFAAKYKELSRQGVFLASRATGKAVV